MKIRIGKILCPVDFSANSQHALHYALAFAQAHDAQLLLLHVIEPPAYFSPSFPATPELSAETLDVARESCEKRLRDMAEGLQGIPGKVTWQLVVGTPFSEIISIAREEQCDLIVLGTHGRTGLAHMLMGSVAEKVVRKAPCPVLTVKHPEQEFVMP